MYHCVLPTRFLSEAVVTVFYSWFSYLRYFWEDKNKAYNRIEMMPPVYPQAGQCAAVLRIGWNGAEIRCAMTKKNYIYIKKNNEWNGAFVLPTSANADLPWFWPITLVEAILLAILMVVQKSLRNTTGIVYGPLLAKNYLWWVQEQRNNLISCFQFTVNFRKYWDTCTNDRNFTTPGKLTVPLHGP